LNGGGGAKERTAPSAAAPSAEPECNKPLAFVLKGIQHEHPMIQEARGISPATAELFGIGFFPGKGSMAGRVVFSLIENGQLVGYAGRATLDITPENPKWKLPPGFVKFVYGLERCDPAKLLILTESFWAVPYFYQRGAQAASLMGSEMTERQEAALAPFATICVALDNDAAGHEKSRAIIERLRRNHKVFKATLLEG
jgi:DNA primase